MLLIFNTILNCAIGTIFIFAGILKLLSLKDFKESIVKNKMFSESIMDNSFALKLAVILIPLLEMVLGMYVIFGNFLSDLIFLFYIFILMVVHIQAVSEKKYNKCLSFGKYIKNRLGYGGIIQGVFFIFMLTPNIVGGTVNRDYIINNLDIMTLSLILVTTLFLVVSLVLLRLIIDLVLLGDK